MDAEKNFMEAFICCYQGHRAFWDVTCKEYLQRGKKEAGYQECLQILQKVKSNATKEDVKRKINSLRSSYRRELKKTKESEASGAGTDHIYESNLWWFPLMNFLHHLEKPVNSLSSMDDRQTMASPEVEILESEFEEDAVKNRKKKKTTKHDEMLSTAWSYLTQPEDTFDRMAKTWADKLRTMQRNQSIIAEKIINDTIFEGELGFLTIEAITKRNYTGSTPSTSHSPFTILPPSPSPNNNSSFSSVQHTISSSPNSTSTIQVPSPSPNSEPQVTTLSPSNFITNKQRKHHKLRLIASTSPNQTSTSPNQIIYKHNQSKSPQLFDMSQHFLIEEQKTEDLRSYVQNFTYE